MKCYQAIGILISRVIVFMSIEKPVFFDTDTTLHYLFPIKYFQRNLLITHLAKWNIINSFP